MSAITPESYVKLVRFDVTKENQITFPDGVAQVDYFKNTLEGIEADDFTYVRQESKIRFPYIIDTIEKYNYLIVQNLPYNYKYYFYYITDMKYVNDEMTDVYINLDVFQTFQFDFVYKKSFVEREHVNNDSIGLHTVPEGLELGEYIVDNYEYNTLFDSTVLVVTASKRFNESQEQSFVPPLTDLNGILTYGWTYVCETQADLTFLLDAYTSNPFSGGSESITNMYFVPRSVINWDCVHEFPTGFGDAVVKRYNTTSANAPLIYHENYTKASSLNGYTPKNKKLLTFPYCFMVVSNNNGNSNVFQYEKFKSNTCDFTFSCIPTPRSFN